jgi:DUF1365 family protein
MTAKVVGAIHLQAAHLWLKGVPLVKRHASAGYSVSIVRPLIPEAAHAR